LKTRVFSLADRLPRLHERFLAAGDVPMAEGRVDREEKVRGSDRVTSPA
jgi:hypothetical protein